MSKALVGRMPECGHVVAIDLDASQKTRREYAKNGYDILSLPTEDALTLFKVEASQHMNTCMRGRRS